jgi:hypothetical protein
MKGPKGHGKKQINRNLIFSSYAPVNSFVYSKSYNAEDTKKVN